ncbi:hypothetical protein [Proteiniborus sp. MB09-C3]|uniref:hypothetical protein n=1 Tax=Proteiniborus sp. MB09-C3 TaxID=3050072 RepID=UPI002553F508|nr:hypothetical protein [Proteiniborus sp. MB09-C3]WIV10745.1 hypothetical protein QO263_11310 [Proteiniborus sp. MB09-C3]
MKRVSVVSTIILLVGLTAIGTFAGYYIGLRKVNEKPQPPIEDVKDNKSNANEEKTNNTKINDEKDHEAGSLNEERIGPNTILEYVTYYTECNHEIVETSELEKHMVNMTKETFEGYIKGSHPKWEVESFSHEKVIVKIEKNHLCQNHYVIGEKNGKIAVFRIGENGEWVVERIYEDSPLSLLKQIDQEKIEKGIITNSKEELDDTLENYIS